MNWKNLFELEMGIAEKKAKLLEGNGKLTGRELFMRDQSLIESDIAFLQAQGDTVEKVTIDESLFQALDLDGEDLPSEDDSDDSDYKPEWILSPEIALFPINWRKSLIFAKKL